MNGPVSFMYEEIQQMMIGAISELSEKYVDDGSADMTTRSMRALIMKYEINRDKLHQILRSKVEALINRITDEKRITEDEKEYMLRNPRGL